MAVSRERDTNEGSRILSMAAILLEAAPAGPTDRSPRDHMDTNGNEIAIVGLAGRFTGCPNVGEFWRNLEAGRECIRALTDEELVASGVRPSELQDPAYVKSGGPLEDVAGFDAGFFSYSPKDAAILDPQHRHFYECAWEALESSGHVPSRFTGSVGVFAGCGMNAYFIHNILSNPDLVRSVGHFLLRHTGNDRDFLPTGVSYKLNLRGPSVAIQTACSTSLVAIHVACQSLLAGECDMALAGGVTIMVPHGQGYIYRENEVLSPDGHCRAFDARAAGTVLTNGVGVVALRRLEDALEDGDTIHAVIRGSAINNDGANKVGYLAPSVDGHASAVAEALAIAGISADTISYLETHGTGTAVGDPIEIAALTQAYRQSTQRKQFCPIGSVKPTIGHTDTAAGVASLIKVVEALKHRKIPKSLNYESPNPNIDFADSPFFVNDRLRDWTTSNLPRRAGISSLGVGGTNAHVIVEEAPATSASAPATPGQWLILSAKTQSALDAMSDRLANYLSSSPEINLADVAFTLQEGREAFEFRRSLVADHVGEAVARLREKDTKRVATGRCTQSRTNVAFMFPGGGTQYPNMARNIYQREPVFREAMDEGLRLLKPLVDFDLRQWLFPPTGQEAQAAEALRVVCPSICAIFLVEYSLAKLWMSWGVQPAAMTGHSLGEYTAACLAGVMSLGDALRIVALRGKLVEKVQGAAMLSVPLPEDELRELLTDDLDLAAINGPSMCLVSGLSEPLDQLQKILAEREIDCRRLHVAGASHCRLLDPILPEFRAAIASITLRPPQMPYVSNVTGTWVRPQDATDPDYWVRHFRQPVRFADGLQELMNDSGRILLEVGPGQTLCSLARQQPTKPAGIINSIPHPDDKTPDDQFLREAVGRLWVAGFDIDWSRWRGTTRRQRLPLPTYPFEHQQYWIEPGVGHSASDVDSGDVGERLELDDWFSRPVWKRIDLDESFDDQDQPQEWLIFLDAAGVGLSLAKRLRAAGHHVATVREGDAFYRFSEDEFAMTPENGREHYDMLLTELMASNRLPTRIAHLWLLTKDESFRPGSSFFHRNQERGFYSLMFLAQSLADLEQAPTGLRIAVISNGMQAVAAERIAYPDKATVLGPVRVIPRELPGVECRSIDVGVPGQIALNKSLLWPDEIVEPMVTQLIAEMAAQGEAHSIVYRGDQRYTLQYERVKLAKDPHAVQLRDGGTYVITGGLGGIGSTIAEYLAQKYHAKLLLIGQSSLPERKDWSRWLEGHTDDNLTSQRIRKVFELEAAGATVLVGSADVANVEQIRPLLNKARETFGAIHGVFHAAGIVDDGLLQTKTPDQAERVFTPKVHGTLLLVEELRNDALDFLVLFSSSSSVLGPAGQIDYVGANCFLDALALSQKVPAGRVRAINWGVWKEIGRAVDLNRRMRGESDDPHWIHERTGHPLLEEWLTDEPRHALFQTRLRVSEQWVLDEHRMASGQAVMPGTGSVEVIRAAMELATRNDQLVMKDVTFASPLKVDEDETRLMRVELTAEDDGWKVEITSRSEADIHGDWQLHVQASVTTVDRLDRPALDLGAIARRCPRQVPLSPDGYIRTKQAELVRFGARWNCLRDLKLGHGEGLARVELDEHFQSELDDFGWHPAAMDIVTGCGLPLVEGYDDSDALFVPLNYVQAKILSPMPAQVWSHLRCARGTHAGQETVSFDITLTDDSGRVVMEIEGLTLKRLASKAGFDFDRHRSKTNNSQREQGATASVRLFMQVYEAGIRPHEGMEVLERVLASKPWPQVVASPLSLKKLVARTNEAAQVHQDSGVKFSRPTLAAAYEAPRDDLEKAVAEIWEDLLGVDQIGINDDFFELGGHSLIAVRLFARVKKLCHVEYPISVLFEAPTIAKCAAMIRRDTGDTFSASTSSSPTSTPDSSSAAVKDESDNTSQKYLVPLHVPESTEKAPFFLVSGMFGNVLNLRHLGAHLGQDQPVYALQARGLYGDDRPHESFEEAAADYIVAIRTVQPHGPYYLGGFSGGGITAFEMAHQLRAAGEEVRFLAMLDSIPAKTPSLTTRDRLEMQLQNFRSQGFGYFAQWAKDRWEWEKKKRQTVVRELTPAEFRSEEIEAAFRRSLARYETRKYPGRLYLFRPPLDERYKLSNGRIVDRYRSVRDSHNHWIPFFDDVELHLVTGDHDSMVLEPHVRVLAQKLKACLEACRAGDQKAPRTALSPSRSARRTAIPNLSDQFPDDISWLAVDPFRAEGNLDPAERELMRSAVSVRRREFRAGRAAAHQLLAQWNLDRGPLLPDENRVPQWPAGVVGSITHSRQLCLVAIGRAENYASLGVDTEPDEPLEEELWSTLLRPEEIKWLNAHHPSQRGRWAKVMFCAKEAVYKAVFPLNHLPIGFQDVIVSLNPSTETFSASWVDRELPCPAGHFLKGRWTVRGGSIVAVMALPAHCLETQNAGDDEHQSNASTPETFSEVTTAGSKSSASDSNGLS